MVPGPRYKGLTTIRKWESSLVPKRPPRILILTERNEHLETMRNFFLQRFHATYEISYSQNNAVPLLARASINGQPTIYRSVYILNGPLFMLPSYMLLLDLKMETGLKLETFPVQCYFIEAIHLESPN